MEGDAEHFVAEGGVAQGLAPGASGGDLPQAGAVVCPTGGEEGPVRAEGQGPHGVLVPLEGLPARFRVRASQSWIWRSRPAVA